MAAYPAVLTIVAATLASSYGRPPPQYRYHPNHKYFPAPYPVHGYKPGHRYPHPNHLRYNTGPKRLPESQPLRSPQYIPYSGEVSHVGLPNTYGTDRDAERKLTFYNSPRYNFLNSSEASGSKKRATFENFVTPPPPPPQLETIPRKKKNTYEVTTKALNEGELTPTARPLPLGVKDIPLALDDEEGFEVNPVKGRRRPEHLNPLVYVDSYGRVRKRPEVDIAEDSIREYGVAQESEEERSIFGTSPGHGHGHNYGYGVLHGSTHHYKKPVGRVKMQVFRGPTRKVGHKKYAPWGYYVVQPADNSDQHPYNSHHY